ncbi:hypothetical protein CHS0354_016665 [Potamilus streckersoni]|uniref:Uncharacterized protein n=1 Tax=Potamilus streckersoni TaxID=2493646 RepID=A0AAE0TIB0_9BIVA|nr:hypothetical protein CHS0354_016665 [Potamilus streckersoni]
MASDRNEDKEMHSHENAHKDSLKITSEKDDITDHEGILFAKKGFTDGTNKDVKKVEDEDNPKWPHKHCNRNLIRSGDASREQKKDIKEQPCQEDKEQMIKKDSSTLDSQRFMSVQNFNVDRITQKERESPERNAKGDTSEVCVGSQRTIGKHQDAASGTGRLGNDQQLQGNTDKDVEKSATASPDYVVNGTNRTGQEQKPQKTRDKDNVKKHTDSGSQKNMDAEYDAASKRPGDDANGDDANGDDANGDDDTGDDANGDDANGDDANGDDANGDDANGDDANGDDANGDDANEDDANGDDANGDDDTGDDANGDDATGDDANGDDANGDDTNGDEANGDDANGDDDTGDDTNGDDATGDDANGDDANGDDANGDDANGDDANVDDANGDEANGDDANGDEANGDDANGYDDTGDDANGDDATGDDANGDDANGDDANGDDTNGDDANEDDANGGDVNGDDDTGDDANGDDATGDDTNGDDANGDDANGDDANGDDANGDDANGDDANGDDANGDDVNGDDTNGDDANGDDANGDDANGDDANGDDANGDEANGDDANGDDANGDVANGDDANGDVANGDVANGDDANGDDANGDDANGDEANGDDANGDDANGDEANGDDANGDDANGDVANGDDANGDVANGDVANGDDANGDDSNGDDANGDEANGDDANGDDANGDVANGDVANGDDANGDDANGDEANGDDANGDESNGDDANGDVANGDDANGDVANGDVANGDDANGDDANGDEANGDDANGDDANGDDANGDVANGDVANGDDANGDDANGDDANGDEANGDDANGDDANGDEANGDDANGDDATGDDANGDDANGDDANGDEANGDDANGDDANGDEANGDDATGDDANGDEANGDDANGDGTNGDEANGDDANGDEATVESALEYDNDDLMKFAVILGGNHAIIAPQGEEALKWRFLFDCPHTQKEICKDPIMVGTILEYQKGASPLIHWKKSTGITFKKCVEELLQKHAKQVQIYHTVMPNEAVNIFLEAQELVELFQSKMVIAYKRETNLYICGKKEHMEKAIRHVNNAKDYALRSISKTETISLKDIPLQLIKRWMEVHMSPDNSNMQYEFREDQKCLHITGIERMIKQEKDKLLNLLGNITHTRCKSRLGVARFSVFKQSGVVKYIERILQEQKLVCIWETNKAECIIIVTAFDKETCKMACKVIDAACVIEGISLQMDAVTKILPSNSWKQELSSLCTKFDGKMMMLLDQDINILEYVCTPDIRAMVRHEVQGIVNNWDREKHLLIEKQVADKLQKEKQKLRKLEEYCNVIISVSRKIEKMGLLIVGKDINIQLALEKLEKEFNLILKPQPKPALSWSGLENCKYIYVPETNEAELIILKDECLLKRNKNNQAELKDMGVDTEIVEITPVFSLKVNQPVFWNLLHTLDSVLEPPPSLDSVLEPPPSLGSVLEPPPSLGIFSGGGLQVIMQRVPGTKYKVTQQWALGDITSDNDYVSVIGHQSAGTLRTGHKSLKLVYG